MTQSYGLDVSVVWRCVELRQNTKRPRGCRCTLDWWPREVWHQTALRDRSISQPVCIRQCELIYYSCWRNNFVLSKTTGTPFIRNSHRITLTNSTSVNWYCWLWQGNVWSGWHKISRTPGATSNFQVPQGWHGASCTLRMSPLRLGELATGICATVTSVASLLWVLREVQAEP